MKQEQKVARGTDGIALDNAALRRHRARGNGGWMPNRVYRRRPGLRQLAMLNIQCEREREREREREKRKENENERRWVRERGRAEGRRYNNFL